MNCLTRFQIELHHFKKSEVDAQAKAVTFTTQIKEMLLSGQAAAFEKVTGTEQLGAEAVKVLQTGIDVLNSPALAGNIAAIEDNLGDLGARLMGVIHEGAPIVSGIFHWVISFESLFHLNKKKA